MSDGVVIGGGDPTVLYEIRSMVAEVEGFRVEDVAESSGDLERAVVQRRPSVVLVHASIAPRPLVQTLKDLEVRAPASSVIVLAEEVDEALLNDVMSNGGRGVLTYPVSHESLAARLASAAEKSEQMRRLVGSSAEEREAVDAGGRGRLVVVAGSKGGVGTSTLATHMALDHLEHVPGRSVCLVDLDIEKGDLADLLGVTHRRDVSDLAQLAEDLSPSTVRSAIHRGEDGLCLLKAPTDIDRAGEVDDRRARLVVGAVGRQFDLVIVDVGSHVTPVTAAIVEIADEVVVVTNPDVLSLRGVRRLLDAWERVGVRKPSGTRLVVNRVSKVADIQPDAIGRLVPVEPCEATLPACFKKLEPGLNFRDPGEVRDKTWWRSVHEVAVETGVVVPERAAGSRARRSRGGSRRRADESGQATLEFVGVFPLILLLVLLLWQVALAGTSMALTGHVANEAARAVTVDDDPRSALASVPGWFSQDMTVSETPGGVSVRTRLPILAPGVSTSAWTFSTRVGVVDEPS